MPASDPIEILLAHEQVHGEFAAVAKAHALDGVVTRGVVVTHVATHGMHHRAQCPNMLRQVGVEKLPPSSVVEWSVKS